MAMAVRQFLMYSVERTTFMTPLKEKAWSSIESPTVRRCAQKAKMRGCSTLDIVIGRGLLLVRQGRFGGVFQPRERDTLGCRRGYLIRHSIEAYRV
jgi:hypothetical protein